MRRRLAESHPDAGSVIIAGSRLRRSCASQPFVLDVAVARSTAAAAPIPEWIERRKIIIAGNPPAASAIERDLNTLWRRCDPQVARRHLIRTPKVIFSRLRKAQPHPGETQQLCALLWITDDLRPSRALPCLGPIFRAAKFNYAAICQVG